MAASLWFALVAAPIPSVASIPHWASWPRVADAELAELRGGFVGNDFRIDFSFEHIVRINGELRAHTVMRLPLDAANGGGAGVQLVQNGAGNQVALQAGDGARLARGLGALTVGPGGVQHGATAMATVIQNTLDNQLIQNLKLIRVDLSGLGSIRQMGWQQRVDQGVVESLR
ncbi:hypothetical protein [Alkalilimnicola sp. S0819]|uniref:hypothetical protein n=1 Tax=Alkalilimnicola sp. S0819 TaxID=2613922 RepID=UPI0012623CD4|nr:hypothetical protein [Alkalilimnicola sp. S0819]KAB7624394.1 hypothetical protein F3N43_06190 [Alkalilimnicola sp. S0819]MPQ16221.1 hypothetical protein [Alkalilimnicola sp. S0819]